MKRIVYGILIMACALVQGCSFSLAGLGLGNDRGKVAVEVIEKADSVWTTHEVLLIPLSGTVEVGEMKGGGLGTEPGMLVGLRDRLKEAEDNDRIKAVILRIDSPGGSVTAADLIYHEILRFKEKMKEKDRKVPVIALMMDVAASGGLYVAMAADEVYALPTTITGSIGVIMMLPGLEGLIGKIGVEVRVIKSGPNKDIGSMWRGMTDEEKRIFQNLINEYYQIFLKVIMDSRQPKGLTGGKLSEIADGRVLDAKTAVAAKLIDGIMYPQDVFERAKKLADIKDAKIVSYEYPYAYRGNIYARGSVPAPRAAVGDTNLFKVDLGNLGGLGKKPQFMYLWMP